jgi:CheY-like chemotaxis protein
VEAKRVLLIEDNKESCELLAALLKRRKINGSYISAECAYSLAEGKSTLRVRESQGISFDCIVADLSLPDSTPLETIAEIKELSGSAPVRALTGINSPEIINICRRNHIRLILKGAPAEEIMEEILYAIAEREPSMEIDEAIARNRTVVRELHHTVAPKHEIRLNWKWVTTVGVALIPIISFCFTAGASLYKGLNDKAENKVGTALAAKQTKETIDQHTNQISDVQGHVRKLEDGQLEQKTKLDNIIKVLDKVDRQTGRP